MIVLVILVWGAPAYYKFSPFYEGLVSTYIPALYLLAYVILFVVGVWLVQAVIPTNLVVLLPLGDNYIKSCHENMFSACLLNF